MKCALVVADMLDLLANKRSNMDHTVDPSKLDFCQYGDHKTIRPYKTVEEGIIWYLNQDAIKGLPEQLVIPLVAHNFGMSVQEASQEFDIKSYTHTGIVPLD